MRAGGGAGVRGGRGRRRRRRKIIHIKDMCAILGSEWPPALSNETTERKRERETETETDTQRDTDTDRQTKTESERMSTDRGRHKRLFTESEYQ